MRTSILLLLAALLAFVGCHRDYNPTSTSIRHSSECALLSAVYTALDGHDLGEYKIDEAWVESEPDFSVQRLVIRLKGPHRGTEVSIMELEEPKYLTWTGPDNSIYEVWAIADPFPSELTLVCGHDRARIVLKDTVIVHVDAAGLLESITLPAFVVLATLMLGSLPPMLRFYYRRQWRVPLLHIFALVGVVALALLLVNEFSLSLHKMPVSLPSGEGAQYSILPDVRYLLFSTAPSMSLS